jgi:hypothetical protein
MRAWPALPAAMAWARAPRAPGASVDVAEVVEGVDDPLEIGHQRRQHVTHGRGVAREDLGPQAGVARRDPGDVAQPLTGKRHRGVVEGLEPGRHETRRELGDVRDRGDRGIVPLGGQRAHRSPHRAGHGRDECDRSGVGLLGRGQHPRAPVEQVVAAGHGTGALAPRHRVRSAVAGEVGADVAQPVHHGALDRGEVGDERRRPTGQRPGHDRSRHVRRGRDDDEVGIDAGIVLDRALGEPSRAEVSRQGRVGGADVLEGHVLADAAQRQPEARAEQPGADDVDPRHSSAAL